MPRKCFVGGIFGVLSMGLCAAELRFSAVRAGSTPVESISVGLRCRLSVAKSGLGAAKSALQPVESALWAVWDERSGPPDRVSARADCFLVGLGSGPGSPKRALSSARSRLGSIKRTIVWVKQPFATSYFAARVERSAIPSNFGK